MQKAHADDLDTTPVSEEDIFSLGDLDSTSGTEEGRLSLGELAASGVHTMRAASGFMSDERAAMATTSPRTEAISPLIDAMSPRIKVISDFVVLEVHRLHPPRSRGPCRPLAQAIRRNHPNIRPSEARGGMRRGLQCYGQDAVGTP